MSPRILIITFALAVTLGACRSNSDPAIRPLLIGIHEELVLGADTTRSLDEQFSQPVSIDTDSVGRIYVVDQKESRLKVFEPDGSLAWATGSRGQGPDEYQLMSLVLAEDDRVLVVDRRPTTVTMYRKDGTLEDEIIGVRIGESLRRMEDGSYLTTWLASRDSLLHQPVLHVLSQDLRAQQAQFGNLGPLPAGVTDVAPYVLPVSLGSIALANVSTVLFAPWTYPGRIHRYARADSGWTASDDLIGHSPHLAPVTQLDRDPEPWQNSMLTYLGGVDEPLRFALLHVSEGLYVLRDGRIVHFSLLESEDTVLHFVELFDASGTLLAWGPLPDFPEGVSADGFWGREIVHKDEDDRFFVIDRSGDLPVVRVVRMELEVG